MTPRLAYPVKEAAQALGVSERTVREWCQSGILAHTRIGRRVLIPTADLHAALALERQPSVREVAKDRKK